MKFLAVLLLPLVVPAAILPDSIGAYRRASNPQPAAPSAADAAVWSEYGLKASESAGYENGAAKFTATAWQLQDPTGAMAAFDWQRPANATASQVAALAAETTDGMVLVHGNYLFVFQGYKPTTPELDALAEGLKNVDTTTLPSLPGFLPPGSLAANSERYITGPASLEKFAPGIPPSVAAFRYGAEAILGRFQGAKGEMAMAVFSYPTPQIAMQKITEFEQLPGALAKRSGPLVAVILHPSDPDGAERLLGEVRYQAAVTRDERVMTRRDNIGDLVINAFVLIGILLVFAVVSGFALGGFRSVFRRFRKTPEPEAMITLHLQGR